MLISVLWDICATPYHLAFVPEALDDLKSAAWMEELSLAYVLLLPSAIAALDIAYSFVAGWETNSKLELHLAGIAKLYVATFPFHFVWDAISVLPWWLLPRAPAWLHAVRLLRAVRLIRVLHHLSPDVVRRASIRFEVFRAIITFLTITHLACCTLRSVSFVDDHSHNQTDEYVDAFYTTVALFAGEPGAGSILSIETAGAKAVATCLIILGVLINAVLFGSVAYELERSNVTKNRFREHLKIVNETLGFHNASDEQRGRVHQRYEYAWRKYREKLAMPDDDFMSQLSPAYVHDMHDGLTLEGYQLVEKFLAGGLQVAALVMAGELPPHDPKLAFHQQVLALTVKLRPRFYLLHDVLFYKGSVGREVFFLTSGCVELLDDGQRVDTVDGNHGIVDKGNFFGEMAVLYGSDKLRPQMHVEQLERSVRQRLSKLRSATARATTMCDCLVLSRADLEECAEENPRLVPLIMRRLRGYPDRASSASVIDRDACVDLARSLSSEERDGSKEPAAADPNLVLYLSRQLKDQAKDISDIKAAMASVAASLALQRSPQHMSDRHAGRTPMSVTARGGSMMAKRVVKPRPLETSTFSKTCSGDTLTAPKLSRTMATPPPSVATWRL